MFQFPRLPSRAYRLGPGFPIMTSGGLPHSGVSGSLPACGSPELFAACRALHRPLLPRHPPRALSSLIAPDLTALDKVTADRPQVTVSRHPALLSAAPLARSASRGLHANLRCDAWHGCTVLRSVAFRKRRPLAPPPDTNRSTAAPALPCALLRLHAFTSLSFTSMRLSRNGSPSPGEPYYIRTVGAPSITSTR